MDGEPVPGGGVAQVRVARGARDAGVGGARFGAGRVAGVQAAEPVGVHVAAGVYIGPSASLRGDFGRLVIETGANIQDCCIVHGFPESETVIEQDGHIRHGAIIHGCKIRRGALIGMGSRILDGAVIGENALVGAGALVSEGTRIPPRTLAVGVPARVKRALTDAEVAELEQAWRNYVDYKDQYLKEGATPL